MGITIRWKERLAECDPRNGVLLIMEERSRQKQKETVVGARMVAGENNVQHGRVAGGGLWCDVTGSICFEI